MESLTFIFPFRYFLFGLFFCCFFFFFFFFFVVVVFFFVVLFGGLYIQMKYSFFFSFVSSNIE